MSKLKLFGYLTLVILAQSCATKPKGKFNYLKIPVPPNYSDAKFWAALPDKEDAADLTPANLTDKQGVAEVDVFFIHPTTYINKKGNTSWNGAAFDLKLNETTDSTTIKYQASIFNGVGRVFAPRYRQAHLQVYYEKKDKRSADRALEMAYSDVKVAFEHYLKNFNEGRPIIIAAHSQGTTHGVRLLNEFFDGKDLSKQLIVAYLVGMPVLENTYKTIPLCKSPEETACFCTWRAFKEGYKPKNHPEGNNIAVTNPLTWMMDQPVADRSLNKGAVLRNFDKLIPEAADAQIEDGLLWVNKLKFPGSFFFRRKNLHIADYNLYYLNVRENAKLRTETFLK
ncbi:MAG: DUF3089 domain-containing protein [Bacteroidota bacterium]